jgi:CubicO group peptidase (beta-lactamase class C family)
MEQHKLELLYEEQAVDAVFAGLDQCRLPGAAVGIAIEGVPVYRKGFGLAHMELPVLLGPAMRMRIGSTTKHFTCLAFLLLCEDGRATIDDPVGRILPELAPASARVTMRQLMGHISGIRDVPTVSTIVNGFALKITDAQFLDYYTMITDVDFEPGTRWVYNNGAYTLLTAAIERLSGTSLEEFLRLRILAPIGMHDTLMRRTDEDFVSNSAALHTMDATGVFAKQSYQLELTGAGGLVSTADDMLRWLRHMDAPLVGSAESWRLMREPQRLANGHCTGYALGLFSETYRGARIVHHPGGVMGGNAQMIKLPDLGLDISIIVNRNDVSAAALAYQVIDRCVAGLEAQPETIDYEPRTGSFVAPDRTVVSLSIAGDRQLMSVNNSPALPLCSIRAGQLRGPLGSSIRTTLTTTGSDVVMVDMGRETVLSEIAPDPAARLGTHQGSYRSDSLAATLTLFERDGIPRATAQGPRGSAHYDVAPITADIWRIDQAGFAGTGGMLTMDADGQGLTLDFGRMRGARFDRIAAPE